MIVKDPNRAHAMRTALLLGFVFLLAMACAGAAAAQAWTKLSPTGAPTPRNNQVAAFNPVSNSMIVFGGYTNGFVNDTWVLSNADGSGGTPTWTLLATTNSPPPRDGATVGYNATSNRMIVFGGYNSFGAYNDVWVLTNADNSSGTPNWIQLGPITGGPPGPRYRAAAAYDATHNVLIVTDGWNGCCYSDVWVLSNADGTGGTPAWTQLYPTGPAPSARYAHSIVYDPATNEIILFGGNDGSVYDNEAWLMSNANGTGGTPAWSHLSPTGAPPSARGYHTAVYDVATNRMVVFGGAGGSGLFSDVWVLSNANDTGGTPAWSQLSPTGPAPTPRYNHTSVFNPANNRMVVFGGSDGTNNLNETWVLSNAIGAVSVSIDIRPNTAVNTISLTTGTEVPVAILSSASFDATTQVDRTSLTFGHAGTEASFKSCNLRASDVNGDGYKDLVCHFDGTKGAFVLGDTTGYLQGKTTAGNAISGSDSVNIIK